MIVGGVTRHRSETAFAATLGGGAFPPPKTTCIRGPPPIRETAFPPRASNWPLHDHQFSMSCCWAHCPTHIRPCPTIHATHKGNWPFDLQWSCNICPGFHHHVTASTHTAAGDRRTRTTSPMFRRRVLAARKCPWECDMQCIHTEPEARKTLDSTGQSNA